MIVPLDKLHYSFKQKPLIVGGMAMEYYGIRKSGDDIDLIATEEDIVELVKLYPHKVKNLWGDLGVCPFEFEIWKTICFFGYKELKVDSIEKENYLIISLEKLLFMKALVMKKKEKYLEDTKLIINNILDTQNKKSNQIILHNAELIKDIPGIVYIEKIGSEEP